MLAKHCAVLKSLYTLLSIMAHVAGQEDREKTTALKDLLSRIDLDELMKKDEPPLTFPATLEEFEYAFNQKGQLRHIKTGEAFVFNAKEDLHRWNQKRYEALGEILTQYVYELLEKECSLTKAIVPVDAVDEEASSFIFHSADALTNPARLLVLIQGSGVVRAGQWARRLIINQDLDSGTQIPFITRAMQVGGRWDPHAVDAVDEEASSFIFHSADALTNPARLLVLIQGSGVVRAGQWARRLIINQDLDSGTQIPFITRAMQEGYGVLVLNPNENHLEVERPGSTTPPPAATPEPADEPAEKRERKDEKEGKKKREFYEKYRNPQRERETEQTPIRNHFLGIQMYPGFLSGST
ncbi:cotranscriptional regulator ARB2A homolog [Gadus morhua]|uniref:cotranscriptional regulator ARB2A homolog n=1 Tax=Gadus morhua TaxID=8049 RepID=UPI0011B5CBE6|nr:cotranscriptional regulator FAM172A homolog [Gadus morhua]